MKPILLIFLSIVIIGCSKSSNTENIAEPEPEPEPETCEETQALKQITLYWNHDRLNTKGYRVYYNLEPIITKEVLGTVETTDLTVTFDPFGIGLLTCKNIYFRVTAYNDSDESLFSNEIYKELE